MVALDPQLVAQARAWLERDPDETDRDALAQLLQAAEVGDASAIAELTDAFSARLQFGTAGLRGALGPGPNRMNRLIVRWAAAGLARYVREQGGHTIVIGFDSRHRSNAFARESAAVIAGAGLRPLVLPRALPTPVLAYAVLHLGCDAGVMVTASHNPPQDNGYKVYLADGSQIVSPVDARISAHIDEAAVRPLTEIPLDDAWETLGEDVVQDYVTRAAALVRYPGPWHARVVETPMHGVGGSVFESVLQAAGCPAPIRVEEQFAPDPDFPTVAFPNPEEPGAMDLAIATAKRTDADLVIAHDPDADRCAVAISQPDPAGRGTEWRMLTGDEVGSLLAWWLLLPLLPDTGTNGGSGGSVGNGVLAQSIVSGTMLASIAASAGLAYAQTLTGFKWISRVPDLRYGYEEALGYCVDPAHVRDKDGITAGLMMVELASFLKSQGRGIVDVLDELDRQHGVHVTAQVSIRLPSAEAIEAVMARLRQAPPARIGQDPVERIDDLTVGIDGLPPTDGIRFWLAGRGRVIIRPSGTEPKVKCYLQVIQPVDGSIDRARQLARTRIEALRGDVMAWLR